MISTLISLTVLRYLPAVLYKNPNNLLLFDDDKTNKVVYELHHKAKASPEVEIYRITLAVLLQTEFYKEFARRVAAEWEEEEERKRLAGLERLQAELEDNEMIVAEVQRTERENFTEEQKAQSFWWRL
ncbi:hypothetical protein Tco_0160762 [Tanacetum coccineum]